MSLVQSLPDNRLDIIGDIHGELTSLLTLLVHLGYNSQGQHPENRKLVFVGDLCDRGPDSVGVIQLVRHLVKQNHAWAILGHHEINLLNGAFQDGSGWFFDGRHESALLYYDTFIPTHRKRDT